jgi:tetratricopeptide (TPR) repeat protein
MAAESDIEILQLYLDLHGRELGLAEQLTIIDRVIELSVEEGGRLHYRSLKAATYLMAGDIDGARKTLFDAIEFFRINAPEHERSLYARNHYADALQLCGCLSGDVTLLDEAAHEIAELLDSPQWTPSGKADLLRLRGDIHRLKSEWPNAREAYTKAFNLSPSAIHQVFAAQCTLFADGPAAAAAAIQAVDAAGLNQDEHVDYVLVLAHIAIESGDRPLLALAESLLRALEVQAPYFRQQCATLLLSVIDTARTGPTAERNRSVRHQFSELLFRLTRYVKLEPNIMGFGLNLGKMIDDANQQYVKPPE